MSDAAWMIFSQLVSTVVLALIGYVSLRYKASVEHVTGLETIIEKMKKSVTVLEADYEKCQQDRRKLLEENSDMAAEIVDLKTEKLTKELVKEAVSEVAATLQPVAQQQPLPPPLAGIQAVPVVIVPDPKAPPTPVKETP